SLLYEELNDTGRIALGRFYARRALRLLPALAVTIVAFLIWSDLFGPANERHAANVEAGSAALYFQNWIAATSHLPNAGLVHTWSLSIEEQFYIVWPLLLLVLTSVGRLRAAITFCVAGLVIVPVLRVLAWNGGSGDNCVYFSTHTRADSLLAGCLLALLLAHGIPAWADRLLRRLWLPAVGFVVAALLGTQRNWEIVYSIGLTLFVLATAIVLYGVVQYRRLRWLLERRPMRWIGQRSYGIYLWHAPILAAAAYHLGSFHKGVLVSLPLTFLIPALSYRFVEQPFLRMKSRLHGGRERVAAAPAPASVR